MKDTAVGAKSIAARIFNLPSAQQPKKKKSAEQPPSAWQTASAQARGQQGSIPSSSPWTEVEETRRSKSWKVALRAALFGTLILFALIGVRTAVTQSTQQPTTTEIPAALAYPEAAAGGVAERFTASYFTWQEGQEEARAQALSVDLAGGQTASGKYGWNGLGKQTATDAHVIETRIIDDTHAVITVAFTATTYKPGAKQGTWEPNGSKKEAAMMNVVAVDGRPVISGSPALTAPPPAGNLPPAEQLIDDPELARQTNDYAVAFFRAYAADTDISSLTAPGANVQGLGGAVTFESLTSWTVDAGGDERRTAHATVRWQQEKTTLEQGYTVELAKVSSGEQQRWQVITLTAAHN